MCFEKNCYQDYFDEIKVKYEFILNVNNLKDLMEEKLFENSSNYDKLLDFIKEL